MAVAPEENERVRRRLLLHLLEHHGQQVRFEASQWTTEFGIVRRFADEDPLVLRATLRALEMARLVFQRSQYVVGYSEPKTVYSLTPTGHRQALEVQQAAETEIPPLPGPAEASPSEAAVEPRPSPSG